MCVQSGEREGGRHKDQGWGQDGHSPAVGHPPGGTRVQARPHLPTGPACQARPRRTPAARWGTAGSLLRRAVSSLLFIRGLEEHTSPADAVQPETQLAGPLTTQGRPVQRRREGGPEWLSGHTAPGLGVQLAPTRRQGGPGPTPPWHKVLIRLACLCEQPWTPRVPEPGSPPPREEKQSGRKQPSRGPGAGQEVGLATWLSIPQPSRPLCPAQALSGREWPLPKPCSGWGLGGQASAWGGACRDPRASEGHLGPSEASGEKPRRQLWVRRAGEACRGGAARKALNCRAPWPAAGKVREGKALGMGAGSRWP